jgi:hypothetical protein
VILLSPALVFDIWILGVIWHLSFVICHFHVPLLR